MLGGRLHTLHSAVRTLPTLSMALMNKHQQNCLNNRRELY